MLSLHQKIEEDATAIAAGLNQGTSTNLLTYPPNHGFTQDETQALMKLKDDPSLKNAIRKILASNAAGLIFEFMNLVDGTTDPGEELGEWNGIRIVDQDENLEDLDEMLHDSFYETYWDWKAVRPKTDWTLDTEG